MPVQDPWGQGELRGVFCRPRHFFLVSNFLRQLCRRCSTTCFLQKYHFFAHSPRGAVGGWVVLLVAEPRFSPGFAAAVSQVACSRCLHPVSPFCFSPHFCLLPPASSPPPLLTLVFSRPPSPACPAQPHRGIHPQKLTCIFRPTRRRRRRR